MKKKFESIYDKVMNNPTEYDQRYLIGNFAYLTAGFFLLYNFLFSTAFLIYISIIFGIGIIWFLLGYYLKKNKNYIQMLGILIISYFPFIFIDIFLTPLIHEWTIPLIEKVPNLLLYLNISTTMIIIIILIINFRKKR